MAGGAESDVVRQRVAVVLRTGEAVLLIHRWRDTEEYFVVPGGGVEPGETIEEAARREMREEASVEILGELVPLISFEGFDERHGVVQRFVAFTTAAWSGNVKMSDAAPEALTVSASNRYQLEWVQLGSLPPLDLHPAEVKSALLALAT
jgi:ADP-ribose pyrophosphatase YjhB (NUDIX family)